MEPLLRNTTNASKFDKRVHETGADSSAGEASAVDGVHLASLPDGHGLAHGSVPAYTQGWRSRGGRSDGGRVPAEPGRQPSAPAGPRQIRHLPRTSGAASAYSQGWLQYGDAPHRNPDLGGQGSPAGGRHAAGTDLRTGLHGLLVRLPAGAIGASSVGRFPRPIDEQSGWL